MLIQAPRDLAPFIEHTLLRPDAGVRDVERICREVIEFGFKGACVNSRYIAVVRSRLSGSEALAIATIGFPLGATLSQVKVREAELAIRAGADELDMVIALGAAKQGDWNDVMADVQAVVGAASGKPVKAIIETALLDPQEIVAACLACVEGGAAFVKTSTGFLGRGASVDDVVLMRRSVPANVGVKASGGIKTFEEARRLLEAGATRLGTSSGPALIAASPALPANGY